MPPTSTPTGEKVIASAGTPPPTESDPLGKLSVPSLAPKTARPAPPPVSRVLGNRDFVVIVDCYADHVTVFPGGAQFRWKGDTAATDASLREYVSGLIQRRQASVRPGEPPYRPLIRLRVAPDGLRPYYHVYPLLEPLRVPMARENLED